MDAAADHHLSSPGSTPSLQGVWQYRQSISVMQQRCSSTYPRRSRDLKTPCGSCPRYQGHKLNQPLTYLGSDIFLTRHRS
jgi:hypothetical protein